MGWGRGRKEEVEKPFTRGCQTRYLNYEYSPNDARMAGENSESGTDEKCQHNGCTQLDAFQATRMEREAGFGLGGLLRRLT